MDRKIIGNYFIGKYGEDLVFSPKKFDRDNFTFISFVLNKLHPVEVSKEEKEIILKLYCEYGNEDEINRDDLKALKARANNLSTLFTFEVSRYLDTKKKEHLENARTILHDLDVLELSEEQYEEWFTNHVHKKLVDEKKYRNKLIKEHMKLKQSDNTFQK